MIAKFCAHQILDLLQWFSNKKTHIYRFPISGGPPSRKAKAKSPSTDPGFSIYPIFKSPFIKNGIYPYIDPFIPFLYPIFFNISIIDFPISSQSSHDLVPLNRPQKTSKSSASPHRWGSFWKLKGWKLPPWPLRSRSSILETKTLFHCNDI